MYVIESHNRATGVIRYDQFNFNKNIYETTINIDTYKIGMSYEKILLSRTIKRIFRDTVDCKYIRAKIKNDNFKSQSFFINYGFKLIDNQDNIKVYLEKYFSPRTIFFILLKASA